MEPLEYSSIKQIFPHAITLKCYLEHLFGKDFPIELPNDRSGFKSLLMNTMVVIDLATISPLGSHQKQISSHCSISDAINRLITHLVRNTGRDSQNCLTFGYKAKSRDASVVMASDMNTECRSIQTGLAIVTSATWQTLLNRIGEMQLRELLENPVFIKSVNGSYLQVSGTLASELARRQLKLRQEKRQRTEDFATEEFSTSLKRSISNTSAASDYSSNGKNTNNFNNSTNSSPQLNGKTTLMRFKLLYNHRSSPAPGLPNNHAFIKKSSVELINEIFPLSVRQLVFPTSDMDLAFSQHLETILGRCKIYYKAYDAVKSLRKFCSCKRVSSSEQDKGKFDHRIGKVSTIEVCTKLKGLRGVQSYQGTHVRYDDSESENDSHTFSETNQDHLVIDTNGRKKRMRGSRGGRSVKDRRISFSMDSPPTSDDFFIPPTGDSLSRMVPSTVGNHLLDIMLNNADRDISACQGAGFCTQDISQYHISPISATCSTGDISMTSKSKSQRNRIKRKMKNILHKQCVSAIGIHSKNTDSGNVVGSIYDPPSRLFPSHRTTNEGVAQVDLGKIHHINRHFPLSPLANISSGLSCHISNTHCLTTKLQEGWEDGVSSKLQPGKSTEIWEFSTPVKNVSEFMKSIIRVTFPCELVWGSKYNENQVMKHIDTYLYLGRTESMSLSQITHAVQLGSIPWLAGLCEQTKNLFFFHFMYWLFNHFITPCIATTFYVTEVEGKLSELFYFKKKLWLNLIRSHLPQFHKQFVPIHLNEKYFENSSNNISIAPQQSSKTTHHESLQLMRAATFPLPTVTPATVANGLQSAVNIGRQSLLFNQLLGGEIEGNKRQSLEDWSLNVLLANKQSQPVTYVQGGPNTTLKDCLISPTAVIRPATKRLHQYLVDLPTVRFVPKKATLRPITNLKAKTSIFAKTHASIRRMPMTNPPPATVMIGNSATVSSSTNSNYSNGPQVYGEVVSNKMLYNSLYTLQQVYNLNENNLSGFGVFGFDEIYRKLRLFKELVASQERVKVRRQQQSTSSEIKTESFQSQIPKYFIAALDLEKCYDNIDTSCLYDLIRAILVGREPNNSQTQTVRTSPSPIVSESPQRNSQHGKKDQHVESHHLSSSTISRFHKSLPSHGYMSNRDCVIHKYYVTHLMTSMERIYSKVLRYVAFNEEVMTFKHAGTEIAKCFSNSIISDNVSYARTNANEILRLLKAHLFQHVVKFPIGTCSSTIRCSKIQKPITNCHNFSDDVDSGNGRCCTQIKGIPQGSVLSSLLCNLYYGYLETILFSGKKDKEELDVEEEDTNSCSNDEAEDPLGLLKHTMIIRLVDDYLIVSTKQSCVEYFLNTVMSMYPHYGGFINALKTKTNFPTTISLQTGEKMKIVPTLVHRGDGNIFLPWCGYLLNVKSLEVSPDATRILNRPLTHSISIDCQQMGNNLKRMIKAFFRMKCHAILLDSSINRKTTIIKNLYELYLLAALRTITHIKKLKHVCHISIRVGHLITSVHEGLMFASKLLRIRTSRKISRRLELHSTYDSFVDEGLSECLSGDNGPKANKSYYLDCFTVLQEIERVNSNKISVMKDAEKSIKSFGSCPLKSHQAMYLGMRAFHRVLIYFPITFDGHHELQAWVRTNIRRYSQSSSNRRQDLLTQEDFFQVEQRVFAAAKEF